VDRLWSLDELVERTFDVGEGDVATYKQNPGASSRSNQPRAENVLDRSRQLQTRDYPCEPRRIVSAPPSAKMAKAADQIVEKGCRIAAAMIEVAEAEVEFARRRFVVKGTDRSVGLFEAAAAALADDLPPDLRGPLIGISDQVMSLPSFAYTCAVCEVEVDDAQVKSADHLGTVAASLLSSS